MTTLRAFETVLVVYSAKSILARFFIIRFLNVLFMKYAFLLFLFLLITGYVSAQEKIKLKKKVVPVNIINAFEEKFLNAIKVKWFKAEDDFVATFFSDKHLLTAYYNKKAQWQKTVISIEAIELAPNVIKAHYEGFYNNWHVNKKEKVETVKANVYMLEIERDNMIRELIYDESGNLLKEKIIKQ
jgi:hypothetical protein